MVEENSDGTDLMPKLWSILGIIIGAMSLTSLISTWGDIGLNGVIGDLISWYQQISNWMFSWTEFFGFSLPQWTADYFTIGLLMSRSILHAAMDQGSNTKWSVERIGLTIFGVISVAIIWPIMLWGLCTSGQRYEEIRGDFLFSNSRRFAKQYKEKYPNSPKWDPNSGTENPIYSEPEVHAEFESVLSQHIKLGGIYFEKFAIVAFLNLFSAIALCMAFFGWSAYGPVPQ